MDVVGSEIGQKMRSAIKAKLTELGCYVDDELPDYVMVMVANKRTRAQMEDDLQLFLGDNTVQFVNWLHQVLRKLQEVTVTAPPVTKKPENPEKTKVRSASKEKKTKEKKEKHKKSDSKKSKKKTKEKEQKKEKKSHKKKKSKDKDAEVINRPNVPPLLMNMEKESEPSITDIFAGQILKNHGITIDIPKEESKIDKKPSVNELKRPILPIIDPATISSDPSQTEATNEKTSQEEPVADETRSSVSSTAPREEQLKEINEIESKIQGLRQKLAEQLDSMSDDEDFLNIRTEAEELMTDFAEDVFQEISAAKPASTDTPPLEATPQKPPPPSNVTEPNPEPSKEPEVFPQIELNLPKRPVRERLGAREETKKPTESKKVERKSESKKVDKERRESPERFTPEREPDFWGKSAKRRLGEQVEPQNKDKEKKSSFSEDSSPEQPEQSSKRMTSKVSVLESRSPRHRSGPASVVRVRPRPRPGPAPLLLRAVADAHRSLLNIPPKKDPDSPQIQRALVLPMRRGVESQKIVIQVAQDRPDRRNRSVSPAREPSDCEIDFDTESLADLESDNDNKNTKESASSTNKESEYVPTPITKKIVNTDYVPSRRSERCYKVDENLIVETINNHKTATVKEKGPTFYVTLDGLDPNIFLAKKLKTEGLIDDETEINKKIEEKPKKDAEKQQEKYLVPEKISSSNLEKKRLSDTSEESDTQVIIKSSETKVAEKRKSVEVASVIKEESSPPIKKKRASPIVFDVGKKERDKIIEKEIERVRERTESAGSDNHVTVTTNSTSNKYDALPSLSAAERPVLPCRAFPLCRFGVACAFAHPPCKFATGCTRRNCVYSHPPATTHAKIPPVVASHVVPAANFKTISPTVIPNLCKYYPSCANPSCHFYHPKPCRYGKTCTNKLECNFYHHELQPSNKWRVA